MGRIPSTPSWWIPSTPIQNFYNGEIYIICSEACAIRNGLPPRRYLSCVSSSTAPFSRSTIFTFSSILVRVESSWCAWNWVGWIVALKSGQAVKLLFLKSFTMSIHTKILPLKGLVHCSSSQYCIGSMQSIFPVQNNPIDIALVGYLSSHRRNHQDRQS